MKSSERLARFGLSALLILISATGVGLAWWSSPNWKFPRYIRNYESAMIGGIALCLMLLLEQAIRTPRALALIRRVGRPRFSLRTLAIVVTLCAFSVWWITWPQKT